MLSLCVGFFIMLRDEPLMVSSRGHGRPPKTLQQVLNDLLRRRRVIVPSTGCWIDTGASAGPKGYKKVYFNRRWIRTTHFILDVVCGMAVPKGKMACHTCDTPACFNPEHLFIGTNEDNMRDMIRKGRARHPKGDELATKLTSEKVIQMKSEYAAGGISFRLLGMKYGVSKTMTRATVRGIKWKHLK